MTPEDFDLFAAVVKQRSGLVLTREKAYLLESRLMPVARRYNLKTLEDVAHLVRSDRDEAVMADITEAMTTNETLFFRDQNPFVHFRDRLLPQLLAARAERRHIRIWSAGASSGQEAYSLAMVCAEASDKLAGWKVDILGTDLSHEMIERADEGVYTHFEVQRGLPIGMLIKYFKQGSGDKWRIRDEVRTMVTFRQGNLLEDFGAIGTFDIVFCRNVLIYFDAPTKVRVLEAISSIAAPDAVLCLGRAESLTGDRFRDLAALPGFAILASAPAAIAARHMAI